MSEPAVVSLPLSLPAALRASRASRDGGAADWYAPAPRSTDEWRAQAASIGREFAGRGWASALRDAFAASGAASERLERVARAGGVVVTTGQQPGLFGGPIYTWSKALSAIALADALDAAGIAAAPVFWAATYDADFAESSVTYVAVGDRVERIAMTAPATPGREMADTPLGDLSADLAVLTRAAGAAAAPEFLALVEDAYAPRRTVGGAFVALLRALLEPLGMAVLDAAHESVRAAERPILVEALEQSGPIDAALVRREAAMRAAGIEPQVAHVPGLSLVFAPEGDERRRLRIGAATPGGAVLEPNVLLRPVAERAILPTAAYIAGPAELAYFAQTGAIAAALGVPVPVTVPRWSGLIIEPHVQRILDRYGLSIDELRDPHAVLGRLARSRVPADARRAMDDLRGTLDSAAQELARRVSSGDRPLVPPAVPEGVRRSIAHRLDRLERRIVAGVKRAERDLVRDVGTARASLFPLDQPQERVLNLMPLLARHGRALFDAMGRRAGEHAAHLGVAADAPRVQEPAERG